MGACSRFLVGLTCFLQLGCAVAVVVITAMKLHNVKILWDGNTWNTEWQSVCLLGKTNNGTNLCYYAYAAGGISVLATLALGILQCCTCHLCGLGNILDAAFAAAGTALWAIAGAVFDYYNKASAMANVPQSQWRLSIVILSFGACALFGLMALAALYSILSICCCGGCGGGGTRTKVVYRDVEAGKGQFMTR